MKQWSPLAVAWCRIKIEAKSLPGGQVRGAALDRTKSDFWNLEIEKDCDRSTALKFYFPNGGKSSQMLFSTTVAEVNPENVRPSIEQFPDCYFIGTGEPEGRDNLGIIEPLHLTSLTRSTDRQREKAAVGSRCEADVD
ncbi:hypothetical protein ABH944_008348 [Caballeronia udeis]|uniref:Uncharacterized protein n=1 Tax=Caballeronia udeis TaxID=1232866 RepID=A0ABW8MX35_9BURK